MTKVEWLDDDQQRIWRTRLHITHHIQSYLNTDLRLADLGLAEYEILVTPSEASGQQLRMSELAHTVSQSRSCLTHVVKRLEARGHVKRTNYADDGRGILASLTTEGMSLLTRVALGHVAAVRRVLVDAIEPGGLKVLGRAYNVILAVPDYGKHP